MNSGLAKDAVAHVLETRELSKYALAKQLQVSPIMIDRYLKDTSKMGPDTAKRFSFLFNITIEDVRRPGGNKNESSSPRNF